MYLNHQNLSDYWVCDLEANGLNPTKIHCVCLTNVGTGEEVDLIGNQIKAWFDEHENPKFYFVGHNFISYDAPVLERLVGVFIPLSRIVDTLVLSYLYHPNMPDGHSLEAWGRRLKFPKVEHDDWEVFSPEMLLRCRGDVSLTVKVFTQLTARMRKRGFSEKSCEIEHRTRALIDEQQSNGFKFDYVAAKELYGNLRREQELLGIPIASKFPSELVEVKRYRYRIKANGNPFTSFTKHLESYPKVSFVGPNEYATYDWKNFNVGSPQQRIEKLLKLGWEPTKFTKKGNPQVDEESLVEFAKESGIAEVQLIADWLVVTGRANMINTWLNNVSDDGFIHGTVFSCGAGSRRMTHSSPNTANIPGVEAKYGKECRKLWRARPDRVLVGVDAKSIQMRIFAHFLKDPNAGRKYWDTDFCPDPHAENASLIGIARRPCKNVFYANMFGAYPPKLAKTAGATGTKKELEAYGTEIREKLWATTPGLKELTSEAQREFRYNDGFLKCLDGGYVRCHSENASLNYKIQPGEAVVMKLGSIIFKSLSTNLDYLKVGDIHDEWQFDCERTDAERVGQLACEALQKAGEELNLRVPIAGSYSIGETWAETH